MVGLHMVEDWDKADSHYQEVLAAVVHMKEEQLVVDNFDKLVVVLDNQVRMVVVRSHCLVVHRNQQVDFLEAVDNNLLYYFVVVVEEHIPFEHMSLKSGELQCYLFHIEHKDRVPSEKDSK